MLCLVYEGMKDGGSERRKKLNSVCDAWNLKIYRTPKGAAWSPGGKRLAQRP